MPSRGLAGSVTGDAVEVLDAIREANALLPGEPSDEGQDPRWQAIIRIGDYIQSDPEPVWQFVPQWGGHPDKDLRMAVATCLLEHLLEYHFAAYFSQVEQAALADPSFADTFQMCGQFGQAEESANAERFKSLDARLDERRRGA
jgi:hypothetical protein